MNSSPNKPGNGLLLLPLSSIIYQDASQNLFIIDIPVSISLAQHLPNITKNDSHFRIPLIYSSDAIASPYSGPSPEPKTDQAKAKVLKLVPAEEREYHTLICGLVEDEIRRLGRNFRGEWCYARQTLPPCEEAGFPLPSKKYLGINGLDLVFALPTGQTMAPEKNQGQSHRDLVSTSPPVILSSELNVFSSPREISNALVKNPSSHQTRIKLSGALDSTIASEEPDLGREIFFRIPPKSTFILTHFQPSLPCLTNPLSLVPPNQYFDFILADPPWPNRSAKRSKQYTISTLSFDDLELLIGNISRKFLISSGIVAVWVTNSQKARRAVENAFQAAGVRKIEEWVWVKTTVIGQVVTALNGVWRKPYEILIIGRAGGQEYDIRRRITAGVPDIHSRKPAIRELVEQAFFDNKEYTALEVFARSLTAGWWAVGDEVIKFNWDGWWAD
ncbi:MT-A70 family protein [Nannizzia gypsea CBS 118893]|uniref:MT-A70 family protein n=1 Tax=Arthroderma gypseum (strain ATCC MYA-4604 / CBS 118893) TaxID=535722 RepID=E4UR28_ARTGP|nr:MT-A70 family protein [Nannizzia gypsea CBS 118893]EFR00143.1 MT-A70 family protein [Nannizzia gypsea CBS 118893]